MTLMRTALSLLMLSLFTLLLVRPAAAEELPPAAERRVGYERAVTAFREQRYPAAYGLFTRLADGGHAPSARLALVMFDHGKTLFGRDWYASPDQQRRWNALAVNEARDRVATLEMSRPE